MKLTKVMAMAAEDTQRFKILRHRGTAFDRLVANELAMFDDNRWYGDITLVRSGLAELAADPNAAAAAAVRAPWDRNYHEYRMRLAIVRVQLLQACLSLDRADEMMPDNDMPCGLVLGLAVAGFAGSLRHDDPEAALHPRFTEIGRGELDQAIASLCYGRARYDGDAWIQYDVEIDRAPVRIQLLGADIFIDWKLPAECSDPEFAEYKVHGIDDGPCISDNADLRYAL